MRLILLATTKGNYIGHNTGSIKITNLLIFLISKYTGYNTGPNTLTTKIGKLIGSPKPTEVGNFNW